MTERLENDYLQADNYAAIDSYEKAFKKDFPKNHNNLESILGVFAVAIPIAGAVIDKKLFHGNGAAGFSAGFLCAGAICSAYAKFIYRGD